MRNRDGRVVEPGTPDAPVGLVDEPTFSTVHHLIRDETITFYTDGVTEARGSDGMYGETRLYGLIAQLPHDSHTITDEICREAVRYQAGKLSDDIAIVSFAAELAEINQVRSVDSARGAITHAVGHTSRYLRVDGPGWSPHRCPVAGSVGFVGETRKGKRACGKISP